jgi:hypothetical protein
MSTPGTAARVLAAPARTTRPARPSRGAGGALAPRAPLPGLPVRAGGLPGRSPPQERSPDRL